MTEWLPAFLITTAVEVPLVTWLLHRQLGMAPAAVVALLAQLITHPTLWFVVPQFQPYLLWVAVAETGVIAVEAALFGVALKRSLDPHWLRRAALTSVLANLVTTTIGLAML
ncbi:MAG: hypothetical protein KC912_13660 [Proteobacteria bacterium]|nr:hypothetical protein [Pseudomonadota bacterium]